MIDDRKDRLRREKGAFGIEEDRGVKEWKSEAGVREHELMALKLWVEWIEECNSKWKHSNGRHFECLWKGDDILSIVFWIEC